jgi:hypothetical protein
MKIKTSNNGLRSGGPFGIVHSFQNRLEASQHGGLWFGHALLTRAKGLIEMVSGSPPVEKFRTSPQVKSERLQEPLRSEAAFGMRYSSWLRRNITKRSLQL